LNLQQTIVSYHRPKNLENLLCPRKLPDVPGSSLSGILFETLNPPDSSSEVTQDDAIDPAGAQNLGNRSPIPLEASSSATSNASLFPMQYLLVPLNHEHENQGEYAPMIAEMLDPLYFRSFQVVL
jgi:hypothetical protein